MRQLAPEVALVPDDGQVVRIGQGQDLLPRREVREEQRHLGREDLQDLLLGVGKERLVALQEEQAGRAVVELHERERGVAELIAPGLPRRQYRRLRHDDRLAGEGRRNDRRQRVPEGCEHAVADEPLSALPGYYV